MEIIEEIASQLNLRWAWEKVRNASNPGDVWYDEIEISQFELNLSENLHSIGKDILENRFQLSPIKPMPFPKQKDEDGNQRVRQYFHISIRDQVAWVAVVNVLGPFIDYEMPNWSYGNRLYRSIWVEENAENGKKSRKIGRYRHSSGRIYLPFKQSWPIYRRHIFLTTRAMSHTKNFNNLSDEDLLEYELVESLNKRDQCSYIFKRYWQASKNISDKKKLYWCSIDFEKFYPSINNEAVLRNILLFLPEESLEGVRSILKEMLSFKIDFQGLSDDELDRLKLNRAESHFNHIPTGLHASGFLANAALLCADKKVEKSISRRKSIAHFRYVDDHIILAYDFNDLIDWVKKYSSIIEEEDIGAKINHEKTEPKELSELLHCESYEETDDNYLASQKACSLDPEFPSPLMTKTLALVSGIGKINFSLMEEKELSALVDQLEHMLLVDLPETEIPEKTRLAFAATRLAKLAENKLENHAAPTIERKDPPQQKILDRELQEFESPMVSSDIDDQMKDIARIFSLIKKVLRDRPDRVRLWTRAILLCRQTGLRRLNEIVDEIKSIALENELASEYLVANTLTLLGNSALYASKIICDIDSADWKKLASFSFLNDVASINLEALQPIKRRHELVRSWEQFCFGVYCAFINLSKNKDAEQFGRLNFPKYVLDVGKGCLEKENKADWAWWASRSSLRNYDSRADYLSVVLGEKIVSSRDAIKYWSFYPYDVPMTLIKRQANSQEPSKHFRSDQGWWYEVLKKNKNLKSVSWGGLKNNSLKKAKENLSYTSGYGEYVSLYDWVEFTSTISDISSSDPRLSEWTALEIVKQIANTISEEFVLNAEYNKNKGSKDGGKSIHPANYKIHKNWLEKNNLSWDSWRMAIEKHPVTSIQYKYAIEDYRYSPMRFDTGRVNSIRGIGIILSCLLKRSFELPSMWNGHGQSDVLRLLPKLLLKRLTCSSYTLGILQSCLNSRVIENTVRIGDKQFRLFHFDDDTDRDPVSFFQISDLIGAINRSQGLLSHYQLSTLNQKARQLTPVNLKLLTEPNWRDVFGAEDFDGE